LKKRIYENSGDRGEYMLEMLIQNPNKVFHFEKDYEAQSFLLELGIAGRFSRNPPNVPAGEQSQQAILYNEHPTHYILGNFISWRFGKRRKWVFGAMLSKKQSLLRQIQRDCERNSKSTAR